MKRKHLLIILWLLFPLLAIGQHLKTAFPDPIPVTNDVIEIEQRSFNRSFWPSGWTSVYQYNEGRLIRQVNHFKGELRMDETYEHTETRNQIKIKNIDIDEKNCSIVVNDFDDDGKLIQSELYFEKDAINPEWKHHNFVYDTLNKKMKFERTSFVFNRREVTTYYEYAFSNNRLFDEKTLDDSGAVTRQERTEWLNERTVFRIIDHKNPETVVLGAHSEQGIQRYLYKLDKRGNWVKRYYVKADGGRLLEIKRKIRYDTNRH